MNQLPAHLAHRQRRDLASAAIGGLNTGSPPHISIAGNRFTLIDEAGNSKPMQTLYLDVCVIDANSAISKIYFDPRTPFDPSGDNFNPPLCFSDNGIGASAQASSPQNTSCAICPHNAWGSAISKMTNKPTKACTDVKKLAVIVPGIDLVFLLRIPPASLKNLVKYTQTLAGHGVDLPDALTRIEFESQGILKFTPMGYVDEATAILTDKIINAKATDQLIGRMDKPWLGQADQNKIAYAQAEQQQTTENPVRNTNNNFASAPRVGGPIYQAATAQNVFNENNTFAGGVRALPNHNPFGSEETPQPTPVKKTRGRKAPEASEGIPPFLQRDPAPQAPASFPEIANTQFGMQATPQAPDAGVQAALDAAFRLPT